jgi:hypothetical protein
MPYGLTQKIIHKVSSVLANYENIDEAILYGSRAKGNYSTKSALPLTTCFYHTRLIYLFSIISQTLL